MTETIEIAIDTVSCGHCEKFLTNLFSETKGISKATVSAANSKAVVEYDPALLNKNDIIKLVNDTETYKVKP